MTRKTVTCLKSTTLLDNVPTSKSEDFRFARTVNLSSSCGKEKNKTILEKSVRVVLNSL